MLRRSWARVARFPLFRIGVVLIVLGAAVDLLSALEAIDLSALVPSGYDAGVIVGSIGVAKIALRFAFTILSALAARD